MNLATQEEQRSLTSYLINDALRGSREQKQLTNLPIAPDPEPQLVTRAQRPIGMALGAPALTTLPEQLLAPEMQCPRRQQPLSGPAGPSTFATHVCSHDRSTTVPVSEGEVEEWRRVGGWKRGRRGAGTPFRSFWRRSRRGLGERSGRWRL